MKKFVNESLSDYDKVNEGKITKSYDKKMQESDIIGMVKKIRSKFDRQGPNIRSMKSWLELNNIGDYQYNKWVRAVVDTMFKNAGGTWVRINNDLSDEEIAVRALSFWHRKLADNSKNP